MVEHGGPTDRDVAERAVRAAGEELLRHRGPELDVVVKGTATNVVTAADVAAEAAAVAVLRELRPEDGLLGEEGASAEGERTWILDALDGTLNFTLGLPGWCAAVVLVDARREPLASAVWDPVRDELFSAALGEGATADGAPLRVREDGAALGAATVATYFQLEKLAGTGVDAGALALLRAAGSLRIMGSGSLDLAAVAAGRMHAWAQPDPEDWDLLPGALLVREAGGVLLDAPGWRIAGVPAVARELAALLDAP